MLHYIFLEKIFSAVVVQDKKMNNFKFQSNDTN